MFAVKPLPADRVQNKDRKSIPLNHRQSGSEAHRRLSNLRQLEQCPLKIRSTPGAMHPLYSIPGGLCGLPGRPRFYGKDRMMVGMFGWIRVRDHVVMLGKKASSGLSAGETGVREPMNWIPKHRLMADPVPASCLRFGIADILNDPPNRLFSRPHEPDDLRTTRIDPHLRAGRGAGGGDRPFGRSHHGKPERACARGGRCRLDRRDRLRHDEQGQPARRRINRATHPTRNRIPLGRSRCTPRGIDPANLRTFGTGLGRSSASLGRLTIRRRTCSERHRIDLLRSGLVFHIQIHPRLAALP